MFQVICTVKIWFNLCLFFPGQITIILIKPKKIPKCNENEGLGKAVMKLMKTISEYSAPDTESQFSIN